MRYRKISKDLSSLYVYWGCCILLFEARLPESDTQPLIPNSPVGSTVYSTLYTEHCVKIWDSSFERAEYIKPKIQRRHLFAYLTIPHICAHPFFSTTYKPRGSLQCKLIKYLDRNWEIVLFVLKTLIKLEKCTVRKNFKFSSFLASYVFTKQFLLYLHKS